MSYSKIETHRSSETISPNRSRRKKCEPGYVRLWGERKCTKKSGRKSTKRSSRRSTKRSSRRSTKRSSRRSTKRSSRRRSTKRSSRRSTKRSGRKSTKRSGRKSTKRSGRKSTKRSSLKVRLQKPSRYAKRLPIGYLEQGRDRKWWIVQEGKKGKEWVRDAPHHKWTYVGPDYYPK